MGESRCQVDSYESTEQKDEGHPKPVIGRAFGWTVLRRECTLVPLRSKWDSALADRVPCHRCEKPFAL